MSSKHGRLRILPTLDSTEMAMSAQKELQVPYAKAAELGRTAVEAALTGHYVNGNGQTVDWRVLVETACAAKRSIMPDDSLRSVEREQQAETRVQVVNETTLRASRKLVEQGLKPLALNFANGVDPGGGFLRGARAQEEVLCRSSALYQTLVGDPMYEHHRERDLPESTNWAIYSPDVPVFRTDGGVALDYPWLLSFITCAAPYAPAVGQPRAAELLQSRIQRVLSIARAYGHTVLVLGAWGCGAFENDPYRTARDFRSALENEFSGVFSDVVFAIKDWSPERQSLGPFRDVFSA